MMTGSEPTVIQDTVDNASADRSPVPTITRLIFEVESMRGRLCCRWARSTGNDYEHSSHMLWRVSKKAQLLR
jgi:hypothetical protein